MEKEVIFSYFFSYTTVFFLFFAIDRSQILLNNSVLSSLTGVIDQIIVICCNCTIFAFLSLFKADVSFCQLSNLDKWPLKAGL